MFGCLFAIFSTIDVSQYLLPAPSKGAADSRVAASDAEPPPFTIKEYEKATRRRMRLFQFDYPKHMTGFMYRVGAPVLIYDSLDFDNAYIETLSAGGIFMLEKASKLQDSTWVYHVLVSDGRRDYKMYLREDSLSYPKFYGNRPSDEAIATYEQSRKDVELRAETEKRELREEYEEAVLAYNQVYNKNQPDNPIVDKLKALGSRVSNMNPNGLVVSGVLAGVLTFGTAVLLGMATWLRNTRAWEHDISFDDVAGNDRGAEYFESEEGESDEDTDAESEEESYDMFA